MKYIKQHLVWNQIYIILQNFSELNFTSGSMFHVLRDGKFFTLFSIKRIPTTFYTVYCNLISFVLLMMFFSSKNENRDEKIKLTSHWTYKSHITKWFQNESALLISLNELKNNKHIQRLPKHSEHEFYCENVWYSSIWN